MLPGEADFRVGETRECHNLAPVAISVVSQSKSVNQSILIRIRFRRTKNPKIVNITVHKNGKVNLVTPASKIAVIITVHKIGKVNLVTPASQIAVIITVKIIRSVLLSGLKYKP